MKNIILIFMLLSACLAEGQESKDMDEKVNKTEEEWKKILTKEQYRILREKGTDLPGTGNLTDHFKKGTYHCAACDAQLFESDSKYESHCGWPSFDDAIDGTVRYVTDRSHGMIRTEIICNRCDGHLGHVFDDGPKETTGLRYCVNSTSLRFVKAKK